MADPNSILESMKQLLKVAEDDESFDIDIIMHINSVFSDLEQFGIGPDGGYMIEDKTQKWTDYLSNDFRMNSVKSLMYLKIRLLFDPPQFGPGITSIEAKIKEYEYRLSVTREGDVWVPPEQSLSPSQP